MDGPHARINTGQVLCFSRNASFTADLCLNAGVGWRHLVMMVQGCTVKCKHALPAPKRSKHARLGSIVSDCFCWKDENLAIHVSTVYRFLHRGSVSQYDSSNICSRICWWSLPLFLLYISSCCPASFGQLAMLSVCIWSKCGDEASETPQELHLCSGSRSLSWIPPRHVHC